MENPERDIEGVIRALTQTKPSQQRAAVLKYFTPDAEFTHPFCRTGSFDGSRNLVLAIYRWYKIMSPRIDLNVHSVAYDKADLRLYVLITQTFRIFLVPFYRADVRLVTELKLVQPDSTGPYFIKSQNDLYQVNQFVKFVAWPFGFLFVMAWQFFATLMCLLAAAFFWPISWFEDNSDEIAREVNADIDGAKRQIIGGVEAVKKRMQ